MRVHSGTFSKRGRREQGSALMLVFALIGILTYLIFTTMRVVVSDIEYSTVQKKAFRCRCLAEMGIAVAMNPLVKKTDADLLNYNAPAPEGEEQGYESYTARIRGEGGKMNINFLVNPQSPHKAFLRRLFEKWGMTEESERDALVDNLIDWVDSDDGHLEHGMEKDQYEKMGIIGYPFDRPFYSLDEVLLVPGFDTIAALKPNWRDFFTVYSQGKVDVNEATAEVLEIVMGTTLENAQEFVESRWGPDKIEDTEDDVTNYTTEIAMQMIEAGSVGGEDQQTEILPRITNADQTTRIECTGTVGDFRTRIIIVVRSRQGQPQILTREEVPLF
jgi:general secretion pathway protein K